MAGSMARRTCRHRVAVVVLATASAMGGWPSTASAGVGDSSTAAENEAPSPPALLAPSDGTTFRRYGNLPFSVSAVDPDDDLYTATVVIRNVNGVEVTRFDTSVAPSGGVSIGVLLRPLNTGTYRWNAIATDVHGLQSPPSLTRSFSVNPPPTVGGGVIAGSIDFGTLGIPPSICEPSASTWLMQSEAAVFNTAVVGFVGPVSIEGSGTSGCESVLFAEGFVSLVAEGSGPLESTLSCTLSGPYTRAHSALVLHLSGECEINQHPITRVTVASTLGFSPTAVDGGLTTRPSEAVIAGSFTVVPE